MNGKAPAVDASIHIRTFTVPGGTIAVRWDAVLAFIGCWEVAGDAPQGTAVRLAVRAIDTLVGAGMTGCFIHTEGVNVNRRVYARAGFRDVAEFPGLKVASVADLARWADRVRGR